MNQSLYPSLPILVVDDEIEIIRSYTIALRASGFRNIRICKDSRNVLSMLSKEEMSLILLDLTMPYLSGDALLPEIKQEFPQIPIIVITGNIEIDTAVKCMKTGAHDYMIKPIEKSRLVAAVKRVVEMRELQYENELLKERVLTGRIKNPDAFSTIITNNDTMKSLFQYVESISKSPQPVLITGETGVGKELMAAAIHKLSNRQGQYVSVNVAGIDDSVFSDTLFGHVKGAFTGAEAVRKGLVEKASDGTLFLDEIGDLHEESQIKLLRLLQEKEYYPMGSDLPKMTDARTVVATNQDIKTLQKSGRFRKDLFYRIRTHAIHIPPLRERLDDIPLLMDLFLEEVSHSLGKKKPTPPDELITLLQNYHFPGNIRELETMVYDAVSNHESKKLSMDRFKNHMEQECSAEKLSFSQFTSKHDALLFGPGILPTLEESNNRLIVEAMKRTKDNQSMAAKILGISRQRLSRQLKSLHPKNSTNP